ncbi:MAG: ABC transporter substrate-binding protein [Actinomycetia bacterium]|nr:ABC transporter substrate-binding protein [Actinomycetes bacterium]
MQQREQQDQGGKVPGSTGGPALRVAGVPEHFNLCWHLALEAGSIDIDWQDTPGGTGQLVDLIRDDEADVIVALTEGTVAAIDRGLTARIVAAQVVSPLQWGVHVAAGSRFQSVDQLEGAQIAISRFGSGSHLMAFVQALERGWTVDESQFVLVGDIHGARQALVAGEADQFLWDRFMTQPLVDGGDFRRIGIQPTPWPPFVVAASRDILTNRGEELDDVLVAVRTEAVALHARPDIVEVLTSRYGLGEETARQWLASTEFSADGAFDPAEADEIRSALAASDH